MKEDLILLVLSGEATPNDRRALDRWRNKSHHNERVYQEYARAWQVLPLHTSQEPVPAPPQLETIVVAGDRRRRKATPLKLNAASNAGTWWSVAVATAAAVVVVISAPVLRNTRPDAEFSTGPEETKTLSLEDGSVVRLGPSSRLGIWQGSSRRALLSGAGFFAIAPDSMSPFVIRTDVGTAEVLGTRFEIRTNADSLRLLVVEGKVALTADGGRIEVGAGEMAKISLGAPPTAPQQVKVWEMLEWKDGLLIFHNTPLYDVVSEVERHFGVSFIVRNPSLSHRVVTAWFGNESFEEVARTICQVVGATCTLDDRAVTVR